MSPSLGWTEVLAVVTEVDVPNTDVSPDFLSLIAPETAGTREILLCSQGGQLVEIIETPDPVVPVMAGDTHGDGKYACRRRVGEIIRVWARLHVYCG